MRSKNLLFIILTGLSCLSMSCVSSQLELRESQAFFELFVDVTPKESMIYIDDRGISTGMNTAEVPLRTTAGTKRIRIECEGYHSFRTTLEYIQAGEIYTLKTNLIQREF